MNKLQANDYMWDGLIKNLEHLLPYTATNGVRLNVQYMHNNTPLYMHCKWGVIHNEVGIRWDKKEADADRYIPGARLTMQMPNGATTSSMCSFDKFDDKALESIANMVAAVATEHVAKLAKGLPR